MKLRYNFVVRNVAGQAVAIAVGADSEQFKGMIQLNSSGEMIFKILSTGDIPFDALLAQVADHFGISEETARPSVTAFIDQLRQNELLEGQGI